MYNPKTALYQRSFLDRRSDQDQRQLYNINVVNQLGCDRRQPYSERRKSLEQRDGWARVSQWSSVCVAALSV
ncbi:MAG: hypothetical protein ABIJ31_08395 [Pseudomonadota bacterium]